MRETDELHGARITVREGDGFANVDGPFDVIVFDLPFRWFAPRDMAERATTDEDCRTLTAFFRDVAGHLAPGGRLPVFFGTTGDIDDLHHLIDAAGLVRAERRSLSADGETYFTYRLTAQP